MHALEIKTVRGLPFIGNVTEIAREGMLGFIEREWRRHGDIFRIRAGGRSMVIVAHPDGIERVLASNRENYVKGPTYDSMRMLTGEGLLTLDGHPWLKRRKLEQPAFHRDSIRQLTEAMVRVTGQMLNRWRQRHPSGGTFEAHREMLGLTLEIVGETLFGQPLGEDNTDASARAFTEALELISERGNSALQLPLVLPTPKNVRLRRALRSLDEMVFSIIATARKQSDPNRRPTLLNMLLAAKDAETGESLSDVELRNEVITLFLAGHETTALLLTWAFILLGEHREVIRRMRSEVDSVLQGRAPASEDVPRLPYLRQAIDEVLRLRGPTWTVARDVVADDVLLGHRVKAGEVVMPVSWLTHRHSSFWSEPERFDPDRFAPERAKGRHQYAYFPFSLGPRMCIGNIFSLTESVIVLAMLLQRIEFEVDARGVKPEAQITLRPSGPVNVRWSPLPLKGEG
jgi:cytochrome P450